MYPNQRELVGEGRESPLSCARVESPWILSQATADVVSSG